MKQFVGAATAALVIAISVPLTAMAHVVVKPSEAVTGSYVSFTVGVPNERSVDVSSVTLSVPDGVMHATPSVMSGFEITTATSNDNVSSITWTGTIPEGQRADFAFTAQMPADATDLIWKATQRYADGVTVSWDQKPSANESDESETLGPYSVTAVKDNLAASASTADQQATNAQNTATIAIALSIAAIVFSSLALTRIRRS